MRYFLRLAYNGLPFHGWQRQPNAVSVQENIEKALSLIFQKKIDITGAGRTDTGVHAKEMFAHFDVDQEITNIDRKITSLNRLLGKDIAVFDIIPVNPEAHARFDAVRRTYRYYVSTRKSPFIYHLSHTITHPLDIEAMNKAARKLLEVSDFSSFAKLHSDNKTNICKVDEAFWEKKDDGLTVFTISADRFLRNMVRAVVGTLIEVGYKKLSQAEFVKIIESHDRCMAGMSMPPQALFLEKISYPPSIFKDTQWMQKKE